MSHTVIIGADPAGLTAAYELSRNRYPVTVLEARSQVGGLFRTEDFQGYRIDLVQYGFETDIAEVRQLWDLFVNQTTNESSRIIPRTVPHTLTGEPATTKCEQCEQVDVRALIYFRDRLFKYPFSFTNALKHIGPIDLSLAGLSYCKTWLNQQLIPNQNNNDFETAETWLKKRFGTHLYNIFFASYFHKLWGSPASCLSSDCALEMTQSILRTPPTKRLKSPCEDHPFQTTTYTHTRAPKRLRTHYPRRGVGQVWQQAQALAEKCGTQVRLNTSIEKISHTQQRIHQIVPTRGETVCLAPGDHVLSSLPLPTVVHRLDPPAPENVLAAADCLRARSLMVVALVLNHNVMFLEHEIHIHSPQVQVSRIQNFKNGGLEYVADYQKTCLGLTYLCEQDDALWQMDDQALVQLALRELVSLRLLPDDLISEAIEAARVGTHPQGSALLEMGQVIRHVAAHPVRNRHYYQHQAVVQRYLERFENLEIIGGNGLETGTAQDASMYSGLMAARRMMRRPFRTPAPKQPAKPSIKQIKTKRANAKAVS